MEKSGELSVSLALSRGKTDELEYLQIWLNRSVYAMAIGLFGGALLTGFGFHFWYSRVQVYQDALLRKQLEKYEAH